MSEQPLTSLEKRLKDALGADARGLFSRYWQIKLSFKKTAKFINARIPNFTDHGEDHIIEVQKVIEQMISGAYSKLTPLELYIICCASYAHDWGNIIDRENHRDYSHKFYNCVFSNNERVAQEATAIHSLVWAHSGESTTGDKDTIKDLDIRHRLYDNYVNLQLIAAILRFADELAESPKRIDANYVKNKKLNKTSLSHHLYAKSIDINSDHKESRIYIDLHIGIRKERETFVAVYVGTGKKIPLEEFLVLIDSKIRKADEERKYANYYLKEFLHFQELSINLKFMTVKIDSLSGEGFNKDKFTIAKILDDKEIPGSKKYSAGLFNFSEISSALQKRDI